MTAFLRTPLLLVASFARHLDLSKPGKLLNALDRVHCPDKALRDKGEDQRGIGYV